MGDSIVKNYHWAAALLVAPILLHSPQATAADLGGNCCADLEERVAELETTVARKGNRKVSLSVSGQVNAGIMYFDPDVDGYEGDKVKIIDNQTSQSRFQFSGKAKVREGVNAGFVLEIGVDQLGIGDETGDEGLGVRQANWWLSSAQLGRLTVGKGYTATSGVGQISLANTGVVTEALSLQPVGSAVLGGFDLPYRSESIDSVVRFDTNNVGGLVASASWAGEDNWDAALRYAGEFEAFKFAAGIGYVKSDSLDLGVFSFDADTTSVIGSASAMHTPSGLFVNASYGMVEVEDTDVKTWHVMAGLENKWNGLGKTTLYGEYMQLEVSDDFLPGKPKLYGVGIVQAIDAAAMDLYLVGRTYDLDLDIEDEPDPFTVVGGARIKF